MWTAEQLIQVMATDFKPQPDREELEVRRALLHPFIGLMMAYVVRTMAHLPPGAHTEPSTWGATYACGFEHALRLVVLHGMPTDVESTLRAYLTALGHKLTATPAELDKLWDADEGVDKPQ